MTLKIIHTHTHTHIHIHIYIYIYIYTYTLKPISVPEVFYVVKLGADFKWIMSFGVAKEIMKIDKTAQRNILIHKLETKLTYTIKLKN